MEPMPLAGEFSGSLQEAQAAAVYPLTWVVCRSCELVQVLEDVPDDVLYLNYRYGSSDVPGLVRHFEAYASFLSQRYGRSTRLLEIGCNDGVLLSRLPAAWHRVGVDPSDVALQRKSGAYELVNAPLTLALAESFPDRGTFDVITSSNAMAHFTDLQGALQAARILLKPEGELILEVHDLAATLDGGQWDTIYHEHKVEWSEHSLVRCAAQAGFQFMFASRHSLHGGLLRCGFRSTGKAVQLSAHPVDLAPFQRLAFQYMRRKDSALFRELAAARDAGRQMVAYGASGRANVWLNQMAELPFRCVFDESPLRAGRWIPAVATPILDVGRFDSAADICLVTAWNYSQDIQAKHRSFAGKWLQTFPGD